MHISNLRSSISMAIIDEMRVTATAAAELLCRRLEPGEAGLYRTLRLDGLKRCPDPFGSTYEEESQSPRLAFESAIEARAVDRFVVGAFLARRLVGLAGFTRGDRRKTSHRGAVSQVYVDPDLQGRAFGRALMHSTIESAFALPQIEQIELGVVSTNSAALRLYQVLGFERFGWCEDALRVGEMRWAMCHMRLTRARFVARVHGQQTRRFDQHALR